jgi:DNA topoisomerase-1
VRPSKAHAEKVDPEVQARAAGLNYTTDTVAGIRRAGPARHPRYIAADGKQVRNTATLARIKSLVIPPAWTDV